MPTDLNCDGIALPAVSSDERLSVSAAGCHAGVCGSAELSAERQQLPDAPDIQQQRILVNQVMTGDATAIEELFCEVFGRSARFIAARFGREADEVLSDLYWHLSQDGWRRLRTWRGEASLKRWLEQVAIRICLGAVKDSSRFTPLEEMEAETMGPVDKVPMAQRCVEVTEMLEAIATLPSENMRLVARMTCQGMDAIQIAEILHLKRGHVDTIKCRALVELRAILSGGSNP